MFGWKFLELLHDRTAPEPTLGMLMLSLYKKTKNYSYNLYLFFFFNVYEGILECED